MRIALLWIAVLGAARAETLADILARMNRAAAQFKNMTASVQRLEYTKVIDDATQNRGSVRMRKSKNGVIALMKFGEPDEHTLYLNGKTAQIYHPKARSVDEYPTGKLGKNLDQFALLGFGTTEPELKKEFAIALGPAETIEGKKATRVDLTPKSAELKKLVAKIELWIPENEGNPIREKVFAPGKDYTMVTYSDLKVNTAIPDSEFELILPPGTKRIPAN